MTSFTFDFDLADDLDETFDATPVPSSDPNLGTHMTTSNLEPYTEITLDELVRSHSKKEYLLRSSYASLAHWASGCALILSPTSRACWRICSAPRSI